MKVQSNDIVSSLDFARQAHQPIPRTLTIRLLRLDRIPVHQVIHHLCPFLWPTRVVWAKRRDDEHKLDLACRQAHRATQGCRSSGLKTQDKAVVLYRELTRGRRIRNDLQRNGLAVSPRGCPQVLEDSGEAGEA